MPADDMDCSCWPTGSDGIARTGDKNTKTVGLKAYEKV